MGCSKGITNVAQLPCLPQVVCSSFMNLALLDARFIKLTCFGGHLLLCCALFCAAARLASPNSSRSQVATRALITTFVCRLRATKDRAISLLEFRTDLRSKLTVLVPVTLSVIVETLGNVCSVVADAQTDGITT